MGKNPVLVLPGQEIETLDMMPRISMLEDLHFRKALPKSFKLFNKMAPFSERLDLIKDSKKFISSLSKDMLRSVIGREARYFKDYLEDENLIQEEFEREQHERRERESEMRHGGTSVSDHNTNKSDRW